MNLGVAGRRRTRLSPDCSSAWKSSRFNFTVYNIIMYIMKQSRVNYTTIYITHKIVARLLQRLEEQPLQFHRLLMAERRI
eukprot:COSAG06_NODE_852_length_11954_cov_6.453986_3_plen_80_part_00